MWPWFRRSSQLPNPDPSKFSPNPIHSFCCIVKYSQASKSSSNWIREIDKFILLPGVSKDKHSFCCPKSNRILLPQISKNSALMYLLVSILCVMWRLLKPFVDYFTSCVPICQHVNENLPYLLYMSCSNLRQKSEITHISLQSLFKAQKFCQSVKSRSEIRRFDSYLPPWFENFVKSPPIRYTVGEFAIFDLNIK